MVAPTGTTAVICVSESTVKAAVEVPLKVTEIAPVKLVPVMMTLVPTLPLAGVKSVIVGPPRLGARLSTKLPSAGPLAVVEAVHGEVVVVPATAVKVTLLA